MKKMYKMSLISWLMIEACLMCITHGYAQNNLISSPFEAISSEYGVSIVRPEFNNNDKTIANRGWYYYDDGICTNAIGLSNGGSIYWGVMFPVGSYTGNAVTKISMYDYSAHTGNIMIYQGGTTAPGTLIYTQAYACTGSESFVEWTLNSPVTLNPNQNLWIVMHNDDGQYVASACSDTGDPNGRWISSDGTTWDDLTTVAPDLASTWMIRACIETINSVWDFENGMNGWTTIDADGDGYTWVLGSASGGVYLVEGGSLAGTGHNASGDLVCSGSYSNVVGTLNPDNYLVSPQVTLTTGSTFSFWACAQDSNYPVEHFGVFISSNGTSNWTMVNEWTMTTKGDGMRSIGRNGQMRAQGNWHNYSVDLSAFTGQKYIAIRHFNCSDQFLLDIDDIVLSTNIQSYNITVSASPTNGGAPYIGNNPGSTQATFTSGQSCTVHANTASGYTFTNWTENGIVVSYNANYTFTVSSSRNLVAHFQAQSQNYTITVSASPTNGGNPYIGSTPGTTQATYTSGQSCTVHANPSNGFVFDRWTLNGNQVSTNANYTFTVTSNLNLVAHFTQQHNVTVSANPTNGGTPYIGNIPGTTQSTFTHGQSCTVHAVPNNGYTFANWKENNQVVQGAGANYTFTVTSNRNLVAHFTQNVYTITVLASPPQGGTVTGGGAYQYGDQVILTATANSGFEFVGWNDGNTNNPRTIIVTGNATYTASFGEVGTTYYTVSATVNPNGSGHVNGTGTFPAGSTTELIAIPNNGYTFSHWQDGNTQNPRTVTVNSNLSFTAYFTQNNYTITTNVSPAGSGTVTGGGSNFHYGDLTTLTANPNSGYTFDHWNDGSTQNPRTITVTGNATYTAFFTQAGPTEYTITTNVIPEGSGVVNGGGNYPTGTQVMLEAIANEGYTFDHWQDGSPDNPRTITVTGNATYTATFKQNVYTVMVSANPTNAGTVSGDGTYGYGEECTVHALANTGYIFINWTENSQQVSSSHDYTFNVTGDHNLVANFVEEGACIIYVDIVPEEGGTVTGAGVYSPGDECTLKAFAKPGYKFKNWTMNDEVVSTEHSYTFTVTETEYYVAHFEMKKYTIIATSDPSEGGTISGDGLYYYGTTCTLKATPNIGYTFSKWTVDGIVISTDETYTFTVTDDLNMTAHFDALITYTISAMAGSNGTITPQGDIVVVKGADQTFIMTPDSGGSILKVMVDGTDMGPVDSYTFTNINRNHTIYVSFSGMGIQEAQSLEVNIYPNPAKDKVYVDGEGIESVALFDLLGNCLLNMDFNTSKILNVSGLSKGIYVLMLTTQDGRIGYQKLVLN